MSDIVNLRRTLFTETARLLLRQAGSEEFERLRASRAKDDPLSAERVASALGYVPCADGDRGSSRSGLCASGAALVGAAVEDAAGRNRPHEPGITVLTGLCADCAEKPCLAACPTQALTADGESGMIFVSGNCILCGGCYGACPAGAVLDRTQIADVVRSVTAGKHLSALLSPAFEYRYGFRELETALLGLGFAAVFRLSDTAWKTVASETEELKKRAAGGNALTSSFCPAWTAAAKKFLPNLEPSLSASPTPMHHSGLEAQGINPDTITVFLGPCFAKKAEARHDPAVDLALTFEELDCLFEARGIKAAETATAQSIEKHRFDIPVSGGMSAAVMKTAGATIAYAEVVNGLSKASFAHLSSLDGRGGGGVYREVMACSGGCMNGPGMGGCRTGDIPKNNDKDFLCRLNGGSKATMV